MLAGLRLGCLLTDRSRRMPGATIWAFLGISIVLPIVVTRGEAIDNATELAKAIIEKARPDGTVDLTWLGDKTCFVPESIYAPFFAKEWFSEYDIRYDQNVDRSNKFWYIVVSNDKSRVAWIYSIDQTILRWKVPDGIKVRDAVGCKSTAKVLTSGEPAEIIIFEW